MLLLLGLIGLLILFGNALAVLAERGVQLILVPVVVIDTVARHTALHAAGFRHQIARLVDPVIQRQPISISLDFSQMYRTIQYPPKLFDPPTVAPQESTVKVLARFPR